MTLYGKNHMNKAPQADRRRFIRLRWIFPVEFRLLDAETGELASDFIQGFTADVSKGGILLRVNHLRPDYVKALKKKEVRLLTNINIHFGYKPIRAIASVMWFDTSTIRGRECSLIGLSFDKIGDRARRRFIRYTASICWGPRLTMIVLALLVAALGMERVTEINLTRENTMLVERLSDVLEARTEVVNTLKEADREKAALVAQIEEQRGKIEQIESEQRMLDDAEQGLELDERLRALTEDNEMLQKELDVVNARTDMRLKELKKIDRVRENLEKKTVDKMYDWIVLHKNNKTNLISSYEGDDFLKGVAFIYDEALAAQAFLLYKDSDSAEDILGFFKYKAQKTEGAFTNAYDVNTGSIAEHSVHVGPNMWIGITALQYTDMTGLKDYLALAKDIGDWAIKLQDEDRDGGLRGGPKETWFSTEHNLDAYAFFTMLHKKTGDDKYKAAADKVLAWLKTNAFTGTGRIKRGKGDATIATDTFSWAIAALGPETLIGLGMDPDAILMFAEEHCKVTVDFRRPDGEVVEVTGFDFAKSKNVARGGVVSAEWTAQMIVSFRIMRDFNEKVVQLKTAYAYRSKYNFYLSQLEKMIISSPSKIGQGAGCLPYATQDNADTGHGWRTPKGANTGSVSSTAYGIFAIKGYNPLRLASEQ
ncbi:MAG: PilZ domain-containing protein [Candidatus Omnitrophota bacterium]